MGLKVTSSPGQVCDGAVSKRRDGGQDFSTLAVIEDVGVEAAAAQP